MKTKLLRKLRSYWSIYYRPYDPARNDEPPFQRKDVYMAFRAVKGKVTCSIEANNSRRFIWLPIHQQLGIADNVFARNKAKREQHKRQNLYERLQRHES